MKPSPSAVAAPPPSVAVKFRIEIERAAAEGAHVDDLILHLTRGDTELLKRDRKVAVADISFTGGTMRYLGVKVVKGDIPLSTLKRPAEGA